MTLKQHSLIFCAITFILELLQMIYSFSQVIAVPMFGNSNPSSEIIQECNNIKSYIMISIIMSMASVILKSIVFYYDQTNPPIKFIKMTIIASWLAHAIALFINFLMSVFTGSLCPYYSNIWTSFVLSYVVDILVIFWVPTILYAYYEYEQINARNDQNL